MPLSRMAPLWTVLCALALGPACSSGPPGKPARRAKERVVIMGFDGMDPTLARKFMDEGKLPNLKKLAESGTFSKLETTQPSESPVAWASFATGVNPGKHNIYDFLIRDFETYMPDLGGVKREPPEFLWGFFPTQAAEGHLHARRHVVLGARGRDGVKSIDADGADDVPAGGDRSTGRCWRGCRCPTSAARWARSTTGRPTSPRSRRATTSSAGS